MRAPSKFGLTGKFALLGAVAITTVMGGAYATFVHTDRQHALAAMNERASVLTAAADEARARQATLMADVIDTKALELEAGQELAAGKPYQGTRLFEMLPIVVGWTVAGEAAKREGMDFRVVAFNARNATHQPEAGGFREQMLKDLENAPKTGQQQTLSRVDPATGALHHMRAIRLDASCLSCHGDPAKAGVRDDSTAVAGTDPLGFQMENWAVGGVHGAYEVQIPLARLDAQAGTLLKNGMIWTVPAAIVGFGMLVVGFRIMVSGPIARVAASLREIAEADGDLTRRISLARGDEIGRVSYWFDRWMDGMQDITREVLGASADVAASTSAVISTGQAASAAATEIAGHATRFQGCAFTRPAAGDGQNAREAVERTAKVAEAMARSTVEIACLDDNAREVAGMVESMGDLTDQTNLLALNAAIEAARAGEHGRGFAVIADELRRVTEETSRAAEEIADAVLSIRSDTTRVLGTVTTSADELHAGEAQARAAAERVAVAPGAPTELAALMRSIGEASEAASSGTTRSVAAARELSSRAEHLRLLLGRFKVESPKGGSDGLIRIGAVVVKA